MEIKVWRAAHRCGGRLFGERVSEFSRERALGLVVPLATLRLAASSVAIARTAVALIATGGCLRLCCTLALGRLCGICPEQLIFQRRTIETANNRLHFVLRGRFYERESFGFLRLVIADYFDRIRDKVIRRQPLLNIVGGDPRGEVAKKNSKAHSVV